MPEERLKSLATFRSRLPSTHDILLAFAAIVFPIHLQAFISWMIMIPSFIKRYTLWDVFGMVSYIQAFALLESLVVLGLLVILAALLPERFYRSKFVSISAMFIFLTVPFAFYMNSYLRSIAVRREIAPLLLVYGLVVVFFYLTIKKFSRVEEVFFNLTSIISVLAYLYIFFDFVAILIVVLRIINI